MQDHGLALPANLAGVAISGVGMGGGAGETIAYRMGQRAMLPAQPCGHHPRGFRQVHPHCHLEVGDRAE